MADRIVVIDASVVLKWVVAEDGSDAANALLDRAAEAELTLAAPEHLLGEVGNGLRKRVAQQVLSVADATIAFDAIRELELDLVGGEERWARTLRAALEWNLTTYDVVYVCLAQDLGCDLITADRRVVEAARHHRLPVRGLLD